MIPTPDQAKQLWDTYHVPPEKRIHMELVARVAKFFSEKLHVDTQLIVAAALLHDIDKAVEKLSGERHPDAAVRILKQEHMDEVADLVRTHPLHMILHADTAPKTIEEKILFLSDKMVKYEILTVDLRFDLWRAEHMDQKGREELESAYPLVKALEKELCGAIGVVPMKIAKFA